MSFKDLGWFLYLKAFGLTNESAKSKPVWHWKFLGEKYRLQATEFFESIKIKE